MTTVLGEMLPLILGAVLAPAWIIIVLLILATPGGLLKASAFVLGMTATRVVQGLLFSVFLGSSSAVTDDGGGKSPVLSTLLMTVGILLLIAAFKKWRKEEDPDDPPPKWMQSINQLTPLKALGMGALLVAIGPKLWVFTLSVLSIISAAQLERGLAIGAYAAYIVLAQIALIVAVLIVAVAPTGSRTMLQRAIAWLTTYNRPISVVMALIFGVYFTWDGLSGLLAS